jgi:3'-phosphoadenosine 5'-phosphosulfate sulfotransferase (PAPS reductase)/FAD synthetase
MHDPFKIDGPTCISFSGGRTSGYMLWRVLQSNGGLPADAIVCFANTGKEEEATLRFVHRCEQTWGIPITWLEFRQEEARTDRWAVVSFETAARNGEPFEAIINQYVNRYLPNPVARICTMEMKIRPMARYLKSLGWEGTIDDLENCAWIGLRADEARRAAKFADKSRVPLYLAGVRKADVGAFWSAHEFDLELPGHNGVTMHGNCDLCFMKPAAQILSLIREKPSRAVWWIEQERRAQSSTGTFGGGARFRNDRPSYKQMLQFASEQRDMFDPNEEALSCFCGD